MGTHRLTLLIQLRAANVFHHAFPTIDMPFLLSLSSNSHHSQALQQYSPGSTGKTKLTYQSTNLLLLFLSSQSKPLFFLPFIVIMPENNTHTNSTINVHMDTPSFSFSFHSSSHTSDGKAGNLHTMYTPNRDKIKKLEEEKDEHLFTLFNIYTLCPSLSPEAD